MIQGIQADSPSISEVYPGQSLDKDAFLKLFITQLQNQNPLEPLNNEQFITEMAQFSSLEELNNLNVNFNTMLQLQFVSQAAQLIGRRVEASDPETGEILQGQVKEVEWKEGTAYLQIKDKSVPLTSITKIW